MASVTFLIGGGGVLYVLLDAGFSYGQSWLPRWIVTGGMLITKIIAAVIVVSIVWWIHRASSGIQQLDVVTFQQWLRYSAIISVGIFLLPQFSLLPIPGRMGKAMFTVLLLYAAGWITSRVIGAFHAYRTKNTPALLRSLGLVVTAPLILSWMEQFYPTDALGIVYFFIAIVIASLVFLLARRRRWLSVLSGAQRWSIAGWSVVFSIISLGIVAVSFDHESAHATLLDSFLWGSRYLLGYSFLISGTYAVIVAWTVMTSGSGAERTQFEFDSITFFNTVAADYSAPQKLYDTITTLAVALTNANAGWLIVPMNNTLRENVIVSCVGVDHRRAAALEIERLLSLAELNEPIVFPYLRDDERLFRVARSVESYAQSAIVMPFRDRDSFNGALVVVSSQPYGFEQCDLDSLIAFSTAVTIALSNRRLMQKALEREQLQRELRIGREIQQRLIPRSIPLLHGWEVVGLWEPAFEVGGDYFDYFYLGDGSCCVLVADVSGKGIGAALYMAKLKGVCIGIAPHVKSVREFVLSIHRALEDVLEKHVYITLAAVGIHADGTLSIVRLGHPPPFRLTCSGEVSPIFPQGAAVGLMTTEQFSNVVEVACVMSRDTWGVVLYTDGLIEAGVMENSALGVDGLHQVLASVGTNLSASELVQHLRNVVVQRIRSNSFDDDVTIVVIQRPHPHTETLEWNEDSM
ncbi:MAG: SpoIIE family protein phosphatase [Candidatus Kapabacteria bacterium]|nr:SpoIIE family protein phosphatase [Candidatus Kapabacteria bacterium]MCS7302436.1 SpoIIE family protein phosphatase [Candidatus Kapabacteria bacterium]